METQRVELACQEGGHDKIYRIEMVPAHNGIGFNVYGYNGRRGSTLTQQKKAIGVDAAEAKRVFDLTLRDKLKPRSDGNYRVVSSTSDAMVNVPAPTRQSSGFHPELPTAISEQQLQRLIKDDDWMFERKRDGNNLAVRKTPRGYEGINKKGEVVGLDRTLAAAFACVPLDSFLVAGELEATGWYGWDMLMADGKNMEELPLSGRKWRLGAHFNHAHKLLNVVPSYPENFAIHSAQAAKAKLGLLEHLHSIRAEGVVAKLWNAEFHAGESLNQLKCKFVTVNDFIVGPKPPKKSRDGHRSIAVYCYEGTKRLRFMGTVGVPDKYAVPPSGAIVEVRYLHLFAGADGHIYQPKYFGVVRNDKDPQHCQVSHLKLKAEE
jgi:ATP-dependent DNA ligase